MVAITNNNTFAGITANSNVNSGAQIAMSREMQEVQARIIMAMHCPRDQDIAFNRIIRACKRKSLAERACYSYPKGKTIVSGASIRLAEVLAQSWGNIDFGIREIERRLGVSICEAYAWDLETNTRTPRRFEVKHLRDTSSGSKKLTSERDIYEIVMNQGARRLRACILAIIPGDIVEDAIEQCNRTLAESYSESLKDRIEKMLIAFAEFEVSKEMIEKRLGHLVDKVTENEFVNLKAIYTSLRDNFASIEDYFAVEPEVIVTNEQALAALEIASQAQKPEIPRSENKPVTKKQTLFKKCLQLSCKQPDLVKDYLKTEKVDSLEKLGIKQLEALEYIIEGAKV